MAGITYSKAGDTKIIINHTKVSKKLRGEDIGQTLVEHAVGYTQEIDLNVIPLCSFAKSVIERDTSLQEVL